ncbi:MAG: C4-type zinc ribbon domain-containing protein [Bacteroidia bacterium]|jgi:predicted  nucleic acid-binding Zn-ribbon protein|nr:C4-type zinc ribbon domain-containing protein [Bacteroidia bacterium]
MAAKTIAQKLEQLYKLQTIDTRLDQLRAVRGELPMEVADLEDELIGLTTRLTNFKTEIETFNEQIVANREQIRTSTELIRKYKGQIDNVKNNREFDALNKEVEIQDLTILAAEKKIGEIDRSIKLKEELISEVQTKLDEREKDLENKKTELKEITAETEKEESTIAVEREKAKDSVDEKLIKAYDRIRENFRNGIAVAPILRGACGGCFAKVPPQLQSDIRQSKKIVICEACGRIQIDARMAGIEEHVEEEKAKPKRRAVRKK